MADITMCINKSCPLYNECYRGQAEPNPYWQSYSLFNYDNVLKCEMYIPVKKRINV